MKLTISITDQRQVSSTYYSSPPKTEDYQRVSITDAEANNQVTAALLRGIADDLDPKLNASHYVGPGLRFHDGGVTA